MEQEQQIMQAVQTAYVEPTKKNVAVLYKTIMQAVEDGNINPLLALAQLTAVSKAVEQAIKELRTDMALSEAEKYGQKTFGAYGVDFTVRDTGVRYDYSEDRCWSEMNDQLQGLQAEMKGREEVLRRMGMCARTGTTNVVVTLK